MASLEARPRAAEGLGVDHRRPVRRRQIQPDQSASLAVNVQRTAGYLRQARDEGRHTTVNSIMIPIRLQGGRVIDSPGVQGLSRRRSLHIGRRSCNRVSGDSALASEASAGLPTVGTCRSRVAPSRKAVESGDIDARRYESYRRVRDHLTERLAEKLTTPRTAVSLVASPASGGRPAGAGECGTRSAPPLAPQFMATR